MVKYLLETLNLKKADVPRTGMLRLWWGEAGREFQQFLSQSHNQMLVADVTKRGRILTALVILWGLFAFTVKALLTFGMAWLKLHRKTS